MKNQQGFIAIALIAILAVVAGLTMYSYNRQDGPKNTPPPYQEPVACTMEAKICPDGSAVGRTGPNCEFSACPTEKPTPPVGVDSGITGRLMIGPTCPVMTNPPDPNCADRGYQTTMIVATADGSSEITRFTSDSAGNFSVALPPGTYLLAPAGTTRFPQGGRELVTVNAHAFTNTVINFDSGIR